MRKNLDTVHLFLKRKWYDMIASGIKEEEYRDITPRYESLLDIVDHPFDPRLLWDDRFLKYVCFHRGYTKVTMTFRIDDIAIGKGNPLLGAPTDRDVFIIKFGDRIR